ncbi:condensation domain-containing protein [Cupriavidus taiwanensis]|uniref:Carrier domain-containing protein n=2 Tax=Cupriavidus taiwanensis TaxID=164546 RepID=A0A7Z7JE09_9BURK|nr:condensation domain-containing protein [Cupriavidus taiwanensis]SOZ10553.1 proposed function: loading module: FAAL-ACP-C-TauD, non ribosomal peptide synthase, antibiotic synthesis; contains 1 condensation domain, 1 AMP-acid ligases II domain, PP-binding, Phosphopantetheine attachment site and one taurine catabolism dioxygenase [Cupriavidus taiwanensis]SOZ12734.1 proposed function: loading module: FAAL-ACP-C-TauD, non ribosomal peptide synthase, antibiotic synthesis; contains 1 condensation dom
MQSDPNLPATLVAHLGRLAAQRGADTALVIVDAGGDTRYSYAALDARVRALAAHLAAQAEPGARALLLMDSGIDYVTAFFACLYAGLVAVPAFEPGAVRSAQVARLRAIAADAEPALLLTTGAQARDHAEALAEIASGAAVVAADATLPAAAQSWQPYPARAETLAFLQYTSGSTASPKGVMVSHGNVMANEVAIAEGMRVGPGDVMVSWLPLYHDMGLIGGLLQPVHSGIPVVLMSPQFFLERPVRWLQAISRHRGTLSGGPDFAFRLCVERVRDSHLAGLDLSSWAVAYSGAEPVRADTLRAFVDRFAPAGFREQALYPCYGLAEATLFATGSERGAGMVSTRFDAAALARGNAQPSQDGMELVGCGFPRAGHAVRITGADRQALPDGQIGEIEIAGPSLCGGYWRNAEASAAAYGDDAGAGRWLRTGDLGLWHGGQLYIAGRRKDVIIVRGQNLYPQDIERAVEDQVPAARRGRVAAFAADGPDGEGIGIAVEISRPDQKRVGHVALVQALAQAVGNACGEPLAVALLLNPGGLPKTTSGKLQRSACRAGWLDDSLDACAVWAHGSFARGGMAAADPAPAQALAPRGETERALAALWQELLGIAPAGRDAHFFASGGNSLTAARLVARLREQYGAAVPMRLPFEHPTLQACAAALDQLQGAAGEAPLAPVPRLPQMPLAPAQQRLWLTDRIAAEADRWTYNMAGGLRLTGALDTAALHAALNALVARHEILRTSYPADAQGTPYARIEAELALELSFSDLSALSAAQRDAALQELAEGQARTPFDLARAPLLRARLVRMAEDDHALLLTLHHIVGDGWSVAILLDTLAAAYNAARAGVAPDWQPLPIQYADYAAHQRAADTDPQQQADADYWRAALRDAPKLPTLPTPNRRPPVASSDGAACCTTLPTALLAQADALAQAHGASRYMVLLAVFHALLHRVGGAEDQLVGIDVAGRPRRELEELVGFFVNVLPLRAQCHGGLRFAELLAQVRTRTLAAFDHQSLPFERIVEAAGVPRERAWHPLVQVLFVQQNTPAQARQFDGLHAARLPPPVHAAKFDLAVFLEPCDDGLRAEWVYATALFPRAAMQRLADAYGAVLAQALAAPDSPLAGLQVPAGLCEPAPEVPAMTATVPRPSKLDKLGKLASLPRRAAEATPAAPAAALVRTSFLAPGQTFPIVMEPASPDLDPVAWALAHREQIEATLCRHGGILLRGFGLRTPQEFEQFAESIEPGLYGAYGDLPKKEGGRNTYRSTPYPEREMILFHNESAHLPRWPRKQWFFCELPSPVGGATPIVDCREMYRRLPRELAERFERKGLRYVRTFNDKLDVSWRDFFKTDSREEVEARLRASGTDFAWLDADTLQTREHCPAVITHPVTGERSFFNQVQLHHTACLDPEVRRDLLDIVGPQRMPRHVTFGDGSPIGDDVMNLIGELYEACAVRFAWRQGDVVMLDNMLAAHARDSYQGPRKIVVAMGDMFERKDLPPLTKKAATQDAIVAADTALEG